MKKILAGWNFIRIIRLFFGIYICVQSVVTKQWLLGLAGLFFAGTALANIGCCSVKGCQPLLKDKMPVGVNTLNKG